nr:uncharacterized protein K02A2.6-like [Onthophagus taurus]
MLYDTGAAHSVISAFTWVKIGKPKLKPTPNLIAYTNLEIKTLGIAKELVTAEINRLVDQDVLELVDVRSTPIEWASPVVVADKSNGSVRLCGDFRVTINPYVQVDDYSTFETITAKLSGGRYFSTIDFKDAYFQLTVHPDSRNYLVIITHKGYYRYKRLPFGVSFAPALFQRTMDAILSGIDGVVCYLDDILISTPDLNQHSQRLHQVLQRLQNAGIRTQKSKCHLFKNNVTFLGHRIDEKGLHPTQEKLEAIKQMAAPTNTTELRSFLGAISYYMNF